MNAPSAANPQEAIALINRTLDGVEDAFSGVKKYPGIPTRDDGRMYGILDDTYVTTHTDGSLTAMTKGNKIELGNNGSITIFSRKTNEIQLEKLGGG